MANTVFITTKSRAITYKPDNKPVNQDSFYADDRMGLYIVSDGIGGYKNSETASQTMVKIIPTTLRTAVSKNDLNIKDLLQKAIRAATIELNKIGNKDSSLRQVSTTLTLLLIHNQKYWIAHAGDSRAYLFRNGQLRQITEDHSVAFEQYKMGAIRKEEIQSHPNQRLLTRSISASNDFVLAEYFQGEIENNDIFLVCSDGLTKEVTDSEISEALNSESNMEIAAQKLLEKVKSRQGKDDTTIVLVSVDW